MAVHSDSFLYAYNSSNSEAEAEDSQKVLDQPGVHSESLPQENLPKRTHLIPVADKGMKIHVYPSAISAKI